MEYGIHFNCDNANKNILSALEEVDNTFFIEKLNSDDEKDIPDSSSNEDNDDIDNFEENFNEMHLSNFEFMENSDSFIDDEVYKELKLKVKEFFKSKKYLCNPKCFEKIGFEKFFAC
ncbi:hypothetical protein C1645_735915 [Glomus cerebriforme]|uniref:Uncharacterized protein n=1 Tax=Glomus cerebriforme TaxID=658196 RepID=A0A397T428_9GLOM|nr:hypothetical protein C1645_735915 [Glomus cerebriforme]